MNSFAKPQKHDYGAIPPFDGQDLVDLQDRPSQRRFFSFLVRRYSLVVWCLMVVAMLPSLSAYLIDSSNLRTLTFFYLLICSVYYSLKHAAFPVERFSQQLRTLNMRMLQHRQMWLMARLIGLLVLINYFVGYVYINTGYLNGVHGDTLWLIFLLIPLFASRKGFVFGQFSVVVGLTIASLAFVSLYAIYLSPLSIDLPHVLGVLGKSLWLLVISLINHVLVRYLADMSANFRLLDDVEYAITNAEFLKGKNEAELLNILVERISHEFGYPHVNILYREPDGRVRFVAAACARGKDLVAQKQLVDVSGGIVEDVLNTGKPYYSNNVHRDKSQGKPYISHPSFPGTQAEFAVPLVVDGSEPIGVLDVQTHKVNSFIYQDKEILERIAGHTVRALENIRASNAMSEAIASVTERLLIPDELPDVLKEIARTAYELLRPSLVVLHEYKSWREQASPAVIAGEVLKPLPKAHRPSSKSIVYRLIAWGDNAYFHTDISSPPQSERDRKIFALHHSNPGAQDFIQREGIKARAIVRLSTGDGECVGLMFLNYRMVKKFSPYEKRQILDFSRLAALAIQKARSMKYQDNYELQEELDRYHEKVASGVAAASSLLRSVECDPGLSEEQVNRLHQADDALMQIKQNLYFLKSTLADTTLLSISEEIEKIAHRVREAFDMPFDMEWVSDRGDDVPNATTYNVRSILKEIVLLAVNTANATRITLQGGVQAERLTLKFHFDGRGFDLPNVQPRGWALVDCKVRCILQGTANITSAPYQPTEIFIQIPLNLEEVWRLSNAEQRTAPDRQSSPDYTLC